MQVPNHLAICAETGHGNSTAVSFAMAPQSLARWFCQRDEGKRSRERKRQKNRVTARITGFTVVVVVVVVLTTHQQRILGGFESHTTTSNLSLCIHV
jgi:hypothetical protein